MEKIKVKSIELAKLRNAEFIQFIRQTAELVAENDVTALKVENQYTSLVENVVNLEAIHKKSLANKLTADIESIDKKRDEALVAIGLIAEGNMYVLNEEKQLAATLLTASIHTYGNTIREITRLNYNAKTATVISLLNEWALNEELSAAVTTLGLAEEVSVLAGLNNSFDTTYKARTKEYAEATSENVSEVRASVLPSYYALRDTLDAYEVVAPTEAGQTVIKQINALIEQYNKLLSLRSGKLIDDSITA